MTDHVHTSESQLRIMILPADAEKPVEVRMIQNNLFEIQKVIDGFFEVVRFSQWMPPLPCGHRVVMVVNEEGALRGMPYNRRASKFYPGDILGDAFLVGEGPIPDPEDGTVESDFISLPESIKLWAGKGHPIPE